MLNVFDRPKRERDNWITTIIASDVDMCCYIVVDAEVPTSYNEGYIGVGRLVRSPGTDYCRTLRGRLYTAWRALRGVLWGYDIDIFTRDDADRLIKVLTEARDSAFPLPKEDDAA